MIEFKKKKKKKKTKRRKENTFVLIDIVKWGFKIPTNRDNDLLQRDRKKDKQKQKKRKENDLPGAIASQSK